MSREKWGDWFDSTAAMMLPPSEVKAMSEISMLVLKYYLFTSSHHGE